jgi:3',5'-cyclic AMP phosphodiesterase CpdA
MRTIAHISDLHFGRHNPAAMADLLDSIERSRPDLVALSGDFTQRARHAEFAEARQFLNRIAQPKLVVPGNHDMPLYNLLHRFLRPFGKYDDYVTPLGHAGGLFRDDEIAVLGLNTARRLTGKHGRISHEQIAQIGRVFRDVPRSVFKAVVTHHPLGMPTGEMPLELAGRSVLALKAITEAGIHLLLSGHHHRALGGHMTELSGAGSVLILHAGTAISTRLRGGEANSYNLIEIAPHRVSIRIMAWTLGHGFQESRSMAYRLEDGRWQTD